MSGPHLSTAEIRSRVEALGPWFHNLDLYGVHTAPDHFLGDFPNIKWKNIRQAIPEDLTGASVLERACWELATRGYATLRTSRAMVSIVCRPQ